jgi:hypothetical protein
MNSGGAVFYQCREAVKDASVRVMLETKLPFHELGRRLTERGVIADPKHLFLLLDRELDDTLANPAGWREKLVARAAQFADLSTRVPPYIVVLGEPIPPIPAWPLRADTGSVTPAVPGDTLTGLGVSPGITKGRARVAFNLSEISELQPGDIIVCSATDPSWVPKEGLPLESPSVRAQQGRAHRGHSRLLSDIDPWTGTYARIELPPIDARSSLSSADQGTSGKWVVCRSGK